MDDEAEAHAWMGRIVENKPIYQRYLPKQLSPHLARFYQRPRVALLLAPRTVSSWDFAKIEH